MLSEQGKNLVFGREYTGSTKNAIMHVLLGKADAGVTLSSELDKEPEDVLRQLRVLVTSPEISPPPLSAHPRVPPPVREAVTKAILALTATAEGKELLRQVRMPSPTTADYERDYKALEVVDVKRLSDWGQ